MPTYGYRCLNCGHETELFQKITDAPATLCPECNKETLQRGPGGGIGISFSGSGFYATDYGPKSSAPESKNAPRAAPVEKAAVPAKPLNNLPVMEWDFLHSTSQADLPSCPTHLAPQQELERPNSLVWRAHTRPLAKVSSVNVPAFVILVLAIEGTPLAFAKTCVSPLCHHL